LNSSRFITAEHNINNSTRIPTCIQRGDMAWVNFHMSTALQSEAYHLNKTSWVHRAGYRTWQLQTTMLVSDRWWCHECAWWDQ